MLQSGQSCKLKILRDRCASRIHLPHDLWTDHGGIHQWECNESVGSQLEHDTESPQAVSAAADDF